MLGLEGGRDSAIGFVRKANVRLRTEEGEYSRTPAIWRSLLLRQGRPYSLLSGFGRTLVWFSVKTELTCDSHSGRLTTIGELSGAGITSIPH